MRIIFQTWEEFRDAVLNSAPKEVGEKIVQEAHRLLKMCSELKPKDMEFRIYFCFEDKPPLLCRVRDEAYIDDYVFIDKGERCEKTTANYFSVAAKEPMKISCEYCFDRFIAVAANCGEDEIGVIEVIVFLSASRKDKKGDGKWEGRSITSS